jgi:hypothetical protein
VSDSLQVKCARRTDGSINSGIFFWPIKRRSGLKQRGGTEPIKLSANHVTNNVTVHIRQAKVAAGVAECETVVVKAQ